MTDKLRDALQELVALKNLKILVDMSEKHPLGTAAEDMRAEYERRKPLAWTAARDALAALEVQPAGPEDMKIYKTIADNYAQATQEPIGWLRAIDEEMIFHHCGVADPSDDYETAKRKLNSLLCFEQSIGEYFAKPPERKPLTEDHIRLLAEQCDSDEFDNSQTIAFARAIEQAHNIGVPPSSP